MNCYSLTIGARNTPGAGAVFSVKDENTIEETTRRHFPDGSTILRSKGSWYNPVSRVFVREDSRQIHVCAARRQDLKGWYTELCYAMHQDALMLVDLGPVWFIKADPVKQQAMRLKRKATAITGSPRQAPKTTIV
jgi:hypothetical protein